MSYRKDPQKRLAQLLHNATNKGHRFCIIINDRLEMSGNDQRWLQSWANWHQDQGAELHNIAELLATLPRVTC
ncbi:hypothetical protein ACFA67_004538 [Salmonella enterica]